MADGITTTFTDDVEVTVEDLNNIAVDLGATDFNEFSEDALFGNDALNGITAALVSKGILNIGERCKCTLSADNKKIQIAPGVAVFGDGSKIRITEAQTIDVVEGDFCVYLKNNTTVGTAEIVISKTDPAEKEDFVILCRYAGGLFMDFRTFAVPKTANNLNALTYRSYTINEVLSCGAYNKSSTNVDIGISPGEYKYIIFPYQTGGMSVFDIDNLKSDMMIPNENSSFYYEHKEDSSMSPEIFCVKNNTRAGSYSCVRFNSISETELTLELCVSSGANAIEQTFNLTFLLI